MGRGNLSEKAVGRQVFDRESPTAMATEQGASQEHQLLEPSTGAIPPDGGPRKTMTHDEKEALFARLAGGSTSTRRVRTGGRPRKNRDPLDEPITRGYVAQVLGVNVSTIRRLEARGQLHPRIGPGGIRYFQMHEVRRLSAHRLRLLRSKDWEMRLAAFAMFRKGLDWRDVAIKLRYDPYRVRRLWRLYMLDEVQSGR
jgi:hypothetical protein